MLNGDLGNVPNSISPNGIIYMGVRPFGSGVVTTDGKHQQLIILLLEQAFSIKTNRHTQINQCRS